MNQISRKKLSDLLRICILLVVFVLPILFSNMLYDRYFLLRITVLRMGVPILFLLWLIKKIAGRESLRISSVTFIAGLFVLTAGIATLFSDDSYLSFWGFYNFYVWGFSTLFLGFLLFIVVSDEFSKDDWKNLGIVILLSGSVVAVYGMSQILGFDPFYKEDASFNRIFSTFGNANFLGGYLVTIFPVSLVFYLSASSRYAVYFFVLAILITMNLFLTLSRASWLAVGISVPLFIFVIGSEIRRANWQKIMAFFITVVIVFSVFLMHRQGLESAQVSNENYLVSKRVKVMFTPRERSSFLRIQTWKTALNIFKDNFWSGVGPAMVTFAFPKYATLEFVKRTHGKEISNYAHNTIFQSAAGSGFFGMLIYLVLWFVSFYILISGLKENDSQDRLYFTTVLSSMSALFIFLQFHFFLPTTQIFFWLMLAFVSSIHCREIAIPLAAYKWGVVLGTIFLAGGLYFGGKYLLADFYFEKAVVFGVNPEKSFSMAVKLCPREWVYRKHFMSFYYALSQNTDNENIKKLGLDKALEQAEINASQHPYNLMAVHDLASANLWQFQILGKNTLDKAEKALKRAYCLGPYFRVVLVNLVKLYLLKGDVEESEKYLSKLNEIYASSDEFDELKRNLEILKRR